MSNPSTLTQIDPQPGTMEEIELMLREREALIGEIRGYNTTAQPGFLAEFKVGELRDYLDHLKHARQKHVRLAGWVQRRNAALANARRSVRKAA